MTTSSIPKELENVAAYFQHQSAGYTSWGKVQVKHVYVRRDDQSCWHLSLADYTTSAADIRTVSFDSLGSVGKIFQKRKKIQVVLTTTQEYGSQIREEIPPILDDQAQLLGVSIKVAHHENDVYNAMKGRYAAVQSNGDCYCIGQSLEDAYISAQLLEKTSKAFIESKCLGGAKPINRIEAWLMQQFYQLKYSKEASKNK